VTTTPLRVGSVPYLNADPLTFGLEGRSDVVLEHEVPSRLLEGLLARRYDCVFAPTFDVLQHPGLRIIEGLCVGSRGPVDSVLLFSRCPLDEISTLALDTSSRSSAGLVQVLLAEATGRIPRTTRVAPDLSALESHDAVLLIGDPALRVAASQTEARVFDLGKLWHDLTGLPFVYALFVAREQDHDAMDPTTSRDDATLTRLLHDSRDVGLRNLDLLARRASEALDLPLPSLLVYLEERIQYELGPPELEGILAYRRLLVKHGLLDAAKGDAELRLMRAGSSAR